MLIKWKFVTKHSLHIKQRSLCIFKIHFVVCLKSVNSSPSARIQQLWIPWSLPFKIMNSTLENYFSVEESTLITILTFLGLILAPLTIFCNILVIIPFCRCSRVRTASNQILLALAITDCILGFCLFLVSITGLTKITRVDEPNAYCHINYAVAMGMTTLQVRLICILCDYIAVFS